MGGGAVMRRALLLIFILFSNAAFAQTRPSWFDLKDKPPIFENIPILTPEEYGAAGNVASAFSYDLGGTSAYFLDGLTVASSTNIP
jgi:hypothetical protein